MSPIDGSVLAERMLVDASRVEAVLANAHAARREWVTTPIARRAEMIEAMVRHLETEVGEIAV
ncbi:MAG: aldehyde dehydrogenase family protein, partial [Actinomycetota bacterium]